MIAILTGCSGNDASGIDTVAPDRPIMYKHLGEFGDSIRYHPYENQDTTQYVQLDDENCGIDAETDGDWIRIQWTHILDNDLRLFRIFRFADGQTPVKIDSIAANTEVYYDRFTDNPAQGVLEINWHYFIQAVDLAGNYSTSDTVHYKLISKAILDFPEEDQAFYNNQINFRWEKVGTTVGNTTRLRLIVMDENKNYIWHHDEYVIEDNTFSIMYYGPVLPAGTYYWRVDALGQLEQDGTVNSGSESRERRFIIQ